MATMGADWKEDVLQFAGRCGGQDLETVLAHVMLLTTRLNRFADSLSQAKRAQSFQMGTARQLFSDAREVWYSCNGLADRCRRIAEQTAEGWIDS